MITIGVDLAQVRDKTALAAVVSLRGEAVPGVRGRARRPLHHELIALDVLRPGIGYPLQVEHINAFAAGIAEQETPTLCADATGVGRPVLDLLRAGCPYTVRGVTITSGGSVVGAGPDVSVPKTDLVGCLQVAFSTRRIHFRPGLRLAGDLDRELRAYSYELSAAGRPKFEGRGSHDDMVMALALAVWQAERGGGVGAAFKEFMQNDMARSGPTFERN